MSQPTQPGQDVPDELLTAALGGYYGHPTAITAADPDVIDGLTAGLTAGMAAIRKDERAKVAEEIEVKAAKVAAEAETYVNNNLQGETALELRERAGYLIEAACIARGTS
jgi:hypothetical protein